MNRDNRDVLIGVLCALGCEGLFGLSYLFTKQAINVASTLSLLGWRFLVAILVMGICVAIGIIKINFKGKPWRPVLLVAFFARSFILSARRWESVIPPHRRAALFSPASLCFVSSLPPFY